MLVTEVARISPVARDREVEVAWEVVAASGTKTLAYLTITDQRVRFRIHTSGSNQTACNPATGTRNVAADAYVATIPLGCLDPDGSVKIGSATLVRNQPDDGLYFFDDALRRHFNPLHGSLLSLSADAVALS